ncbi:helix-turn-helix domain-containing protein [Xenorhabdus sp. XENO-1]|uniref:helix-turn-helix domain-containing protein n=1 Tax=Xenorhabdus bovienii TaxID=40576 RepID=UPI0020CA2C9C|nr:helix-turn-helix domain-containing protein [Xenorhabdus bovienii subsp. africana]
MSLEKDGFSQRLLSERARKGLTQQELATMIGISQRQIAAYEAGASKPRIGTLMKLSNALNVGFQWLASYSIDIGDVRTIGVKDSAKTINAIDIPLIEIDSVIPWLKNDLYKQSITTYVTVGSEVSSKAFAVVQNDPAMSSISKEGFAFPAGSTVVFDGRKKPVNDGDFVLVVINHKVAVFRQIFIGATECNLVPLDSRYPIEKITTESIEKYHNLVIPAVQVIFSLPALERKEAP